MYSPMNRINEAMKGLPEKFHAYIDANQLFSAGDKLLVAVSGGIDSMVLLDLLIHDRYRIEVLHCNFQLRGKESDDDEKFVTDFCREHALPIFSQSFETEDYAIKNGISVQMAARELRYHWFEKMLEVRTAQYLLVAHHADDSVETLLMNLIRGTGIRGLTGIPVRNGKVVRPLLFAFRQEIEDHARIRSLPYREDQSNRSTKYLRNKVRHELIPFLEQVNPGFRENSRETMRILSSQKAVLDDYIEQRSHWMSEDDDHRINIPFDQLRGEPHLGLVLFELLSPLGFNAAQVDLLLDLAGNESGKEIRSTSHIIHVGRESLKIEMIRDAASPTFPIPVADEEFLEPIHLIARILTPGVDINPDPGHAYLDMQRLTSHLILRRWQPGDRFKPLGMNRFKKLSDFFIDQRIDVPDKQKLWLLCSEGDIIWIVGHRIDDRFKVTGKSKQILHIHYLPR